MKWQKTNKVWWYCKILLGVSGLVIMSIGTKKQAWPHLMKAFLFLERHVDIIIIIIILCTYRYVKIYIQMRTHAYIYTFIYIQIYIHIYLHVYTYICPYGDACDVMEMDTVTQVQILDKADCISHSINTFGKGMNPIILPPAMGK